MIFGIMVLFTICLLVSRGLPANGMTEVVKKLLNFAAFIAIFCGVIVFPMTLIMCLSGRNRKYWIEADQLCAQSSKKPMTLNLPECTYYSQGNLGADKNGYYLGATRPRITVYDGNQTISLGYSEASSQRWSEYFDFIGVPRSAKFPWLRLAVTTVVAIVVGAAFGYLVERVLAVVGGPAIPLGSLAFIGSLDGGLLAVFYVGTRHKMGKTNVVEEYPALVVLLIVSAFSGLAYQWSNVWQVSLANAILGVVCAWAILPGRTAVSQQPPESSSR